MLLRTLLGSAALVLSCSGWVTCRALAPDYRGKVLHVLVGDTLEVLHAQATHDQIMVQISSVRLKQKWSFIQSQPIDLQGGHFGFALKSWPPLKPRKGLLPLAFCEVRPFLTGHYWVQIIST